MSKEDWIILRLLYAACMARSPLANTEHYARAAQHLVKTYGLKQVGECADLLKQESRA
jgi:hypothetical protein